MAVQTPIDEKTSEGATSKVVDEEWEKFKQSKKQHLERLHKIVKRQEEENRLTKEKIKAKSMKLIMKLNSKEHLDDRSKQLLERLSQNLI